MSIVDRLRNIANNKGLQEADVNLLSEVAYNILYGSVPLKNSEVTFFKRHKPKLRVLCSKANWKIRKRNLTALLVKRMILVATRYLNG
jgi:hypothetical protein